MASLTITAYATAQSTTAGIVIGYIANLWPYWEVAESDSLSEEKQTIITYCIALVAA